MLDNHIVTLVLVGNTNLTEESISGLAHDHGGEELSAEPSTATRRHRSLDDGDLEIGSLLAQDVSGTQTAGSSADDDNVGLGIVVQVLEVATSHGAGDLALPDGGELEVIPITKHFLNGLGVDVLDRMDWELGSRGSKLNRAGSRGDGSRGRHDWGPIVVRHFEVSREEDMILSLVLSRSSFAVYSQPHPFLLPSCPRSIELSDGETTRVEDGHRLMHDTLPEECVPNQVWTRLPLKGSMAASRREPYRFGE